MFGKHNLLCKWLFHIYYLSKIKHDMKGCVCKVMQFKSSLTGFKGLICFRWTGLRVCVPAVQEFRVQIRAIPASSRDLVLFPRVGFRDTIPQGCRRRKFTVFLWGQMMKSRVEYGGNQHFYNQRSVCTCTATCRLDASCGDPFRAFAELA